MTIDTWKSADELVEMYATPESHAAIARAKKIVYQPGLLLNWQAHLLFALARMRAYASPPNALEVGTYFGYSAAIIAQAMPEHKIVTVELAEYHAKVAAEALAPFRNIGVERARAGEWFPTLPDDLRFSFIFVDSYHKGYLGDLRWLQSRLTFPGLMLCHDHTPNAGAYPWQLEFMKEIEPDAIFRDEYYTGMITWRAEP